MKIFMIGLSLLFSTTVFGLLENCPGIGCPAPTTSAPLTSGPIYESQKPFREKVKKHFQEQLQKLGYSMEPGFSLVINNIERSHSADVLVRKGTIESSFLLNSNEICTNRSFLNAIFFWSYDESKYIAISPSDLEEKLLFKCFNVETGTQNSSSFLLSFPSDEETRNFLTKSLR